MRCPICTKLMLTSSNQTIEEEQGALVITIRRCHPCAQTYEEIWASKNYRGLESQRSFYPVKSIAPDAPTVTRRPTRTRRVQAHACVG